MRFSLSLPPIVTLLLLAFLWLILLVLLVWFAFGVRRSPDEERGESPSKKPRTEWDGLEVRRPEPATRAPRPTPQPPTVRVVTPAERTQPQPDPATDAQDDFDDFNQPERRRDDLDF